MGPGQAQRLRSIGVVFWHSEDRVAAAEIAAEFRIFKQIHSVELKIVTVWLRRKFSRLQIAITTKFEVACAKEVRSS